MSAREWLILAGWVVTIAALIVWASRRIDRDEEVLEHSAEMQNWPEG